MPGRGAGQSQATSTIVLKPAAGDLHLKVRHRKEIVVEGAYTSGESVPTKDVPRRHRMFPRGAGWSSRPGTLELGDEWDGFAESENACTRFGYVCPSGEQTETTPTAAWGAPQKILTFNGDLFFIFLNHIAYKASGTGVLTSLYSNSGDSFTDAEVWNGSLRVAELCTHTTTGIHFFVTLTPGGAPYTIINPTPASPAGTAATAATPQCRLLQTAFWEYQGVSDFRLVGQVSDTQFRFMITPDGDPYDDANWGTTTRVGESTYAIRRMVSSHDTVWFVKRDGVYAVTDKNASAGGENLTPYWSDQLDDSDIRINVYYWGQYVVASHAFGIDMIDVNSWQVQDRPHQISIGYGRPNNTALNGFYTAFGTDQGWLVAAMRSVSGQSYVMYGTARRRESPTAGVTEVDWFPEVGPFTSGRDITCVAVHTVAATGRPYLWIGLQDQSGNPYIVSVEGFIGNSPLADSSHRYNTTASITGTDEHWAARGATKGALRGTLNVRNCGSGRTVAFHAVAGAGTAFGAANATVSTNVETSTFNLTSVRGSVIRWKAVLTSTATVPVVIDEVELKANLGFPLRRRGTWLVELSDETDGDLPNFEQPATNEAALVALCQSVEDFTVLDDEGNTKTVVLDNVLPWRREDTPMTDLGQQQKVRLVSVSYQEIA
jgi:hypothetical protein